MFREGDTVYDPRFEKAGRVNYTSDHVTAAEFGDQMSRYNARGYSDSQDDLPLLSFTPWTQRAVTERPWEPEVGELYLCRWESGSLCVCRLEGDAPKVDNHKRFKFTCPGQKGLCYFTTPNIFPFTPEAARTLLGEPKPEQSINPRPFNSGDKVVANSALASFLDSKSKKGEYGGKVANATANGFCVSFGGELSWTFTTDGKLHPIHGKYPNAAVLLIEDEPQDEPKPFGPEDYRNGTPIYDQDGNKWFVSGHLTDMSGEFPLIISRHGGSILERMSTDGRSRDSHSTFTRTK